MWEVVAKQCGECKCSGTASYVTDVMFGCEPMQTCFRWRLICFEDFVTVCVPFAHAQAMLKYDAKAREVQLVVDRAYSAGEPVYAWCGPQPNRRLLLNYSIVDDNNPYGAAVMLSHL